VKTLIEAVKECDGRFCEDIAMICLSVTTFTIMALSIAQIT